MRPSAGIGCFVLIAILAGAVALGASAGAFVNAPSIVFLAFGTLALSLMSFGLLPLARGLWALRVLVADASPTGLSAEDASILRGVIVHAYTWAAVLTLIGMVQILWDLDDPGMLTRGIGVLLIVPFYAMLGAECVLRPALHQVRLKLARPTEEDRSETAEE